MPCVVNFYFRQTEQLGGKKTGNGSASLILEMHHCGRKPSNCIHMLLTPLRISKPVIREAFKVSLCEVCDKAVVRKGGRDGRFFAW